MKVLTDESREEDLPDKATESLVSEQVPGVQLCYAERRDSSATICCPSLNLFLQKILAKQNMNRIYEYMNRKFSAKYFHISKNKASKEMNFNFPFYGLFGPTKLSH